MYPNPLLPLISFFFLFRPVPFFFFSQAFEDKPDPSHVTQLSWNPRVFLYKDFLSDQECNHLIALAKDKLKPSQVNDDATGKAILAQGRTSSGMFLKLQQDEVVARIEKKIAAWTFLPEENGEAIQILQYENGQKYDPHFDYFTDNFHQVGGHRVATVLMYLSDVQKGGETIFPQSKRRISEQKDDDIWSDCARNGFAVKPVKGDALLFFNLHPNGTTDPLSEHGSCPVLHGEKWSATKWIHVRFFGKHMKKTSSKECQDYHPLCSYWAVTGKCTMNPHYMIGSKYSPGHCRKSCEVCS